MILNEVTSWRDPSLSLSEAAMGVASDGSCNGAASDGRACENGDVNN